LLFGAHHRLSLSQLRAQAGPLVAGGRDLAHDRVHHLRPVLHGRLTAAAQPVPAADRHQRPHPGQKATLLNVGLIAACYLFLGHSTEVSFLSIITAGNFAADLAPMLLVAYITTMLSQDILNAMARIKLISETDEMTHTYNMRAFNALARRECALAKRYNRTFSLLMVDSDNLKK